VKKIKEIVAFAILICLTLTSIQSVLAQTVSAPKIMGPFIGGGAAPSQFYLAFINMTEASVTLTGAGTSSATYTFEMTMKSSGGTNTLSDSHWMTPGWQPRFAPPLDKIVIFEVLYEWSIWDTSGKLPILLGVLRIYWNAWHANEGTVYWNVRICPPSAIIQACENAGIGGQTKYPTSLTPLILGKSVSLTISQTDLVNLFPTLLSPGTLWRCSSHAVFGSDVYYITERTSLPLVVG
jgi:hypothetical protein